jgi:hypothetical protein
MVIIVVVMTVMVYSYATGLLGQLLISPNQPKESVAMEYSSFAPSNNNVTLYLRNTGTAAVTITTYYVKDAFGNQYAKLNWVGPQSSPATLATATLLISSACTGCVTTGTAFTFATGNSYTVTIVSSRNGQFTFSIIR